MSKTPEDFYNTHIGKAFNYGGSWGAQCVEGFYAFGHYIGFTIPRGVGSAKYYANSTWRSTLSTWFQYLPPSESIRNGDWVIWPNGTHGHVAMFYAGKAFGQNQVGTGNGHAFTLNSWNFGNRACAYRLKAWANQNFGGSTSGGSASSGGSGSVGFRKYQIPEGELRGIARLCQQEQGSPTGAAAEASLMANRFELYGSKYNSLYLYVRNSGWFAHAAKWLALSPDEDIYRAVKSVLIDGKRTLPNYIDEHDCFSDISRLSTGGSVSNRAAYIQDKTVVYNIYEATYTFYCFPTSTSDPFGYTANAKKLAAQKGLNGTVGANNDSDSASANIYTPLYTTKNDRNDATIREVAYSDNQGKPQVDASTTRFSVINYTSALAELHETIGAAAGMVTADGTSLGKVDTSKITPHSAKVIVDFFIDKGLSAAVAVGFAANIRAMSNYSSSKIDKDTGAVGIIQWTGKRKDEMREAVGSGFKYNLSGQLNYLWSELSSNFSSVLTKLKTDVKDNNESEAISATTIIYTQLLKSPQHISVSTLSGYAKELWSKVVIISNASAVPQGQQVTSSDGIKSQSGKVLTLSASIEIPAALNQTGIIADYTGYVRNWACNTTQRKLYDIWTNTGKKSSNSIATLNGYYLVAVRPKFGKCGDVIAITLADGTTFICIIGDQKGSDAGNDWGHPFGNQISLVEFENVGTHQSLNTSLNTLGWRTKKVARIVNYGSWLQ